MKTTEHWVWKREYTKMWSQQDIVRFCWVSLILLPRERVQQRTVEHTDEHIADVPVPQMSGEINRQERLCERPCELIVDVFVPQEVARISDRVLVEQVLVGQVVDEPMPFILENVEDKEIMPQEEVKRTVELNVRLLVPQVVDEPCAGGPDKLSGGLLEAHRRPD